MADRRLELSGLLAITIAGATVWLAYHPDHPALEPLPLAAIDRTTTPVRPLPALAADPSRLARVRELLGTRLLAGDLGPYRLLGDVEPPARWAELAAALDAAYAERTGVDPLGVPAETVAVFAERADYRELQRGEDQLAGLDPDGHAGFGLAALTLEAEPGGVAEATLVHELVHFVNRRALGPSLPPWLEEGLAEDLAWTRFDAGRGGFRWGELRPGLHRQGSRLVMVGAVAGIDRLAAAHARGELPWIAELIALDWRDFVAAGAELRYAHARLLVGFLLDDPRLGGGFRGFLAGLAAGGDADRPALEAALGHRLAELELGFRSELQARKAREIDAGVRALTGPGETVRPERDAGRQSPANGSSSRQADEPSA
jgi:hypothetical protein